MKYSQKVVLYRTTYQVLPLKRNAWRKDNVSGCKLRFQDVTILFSNCTDISLKPVTCNVLNGNY